MRRLLLRTGTVLLALAGLARADVYTDGTLTADLTRTGDDVAGTLTLGGQTYPAKAHVTGTRVAGTFQANGNAFDFTAVLAGNTLTLTTGGKTYTLARQGASNPLDGPAAAATALPAGYTEETKTDAGLAVTATKPAAASVGDALSAVLPDVAKLLDVRPTVTGAVEDAKTHASGYATFKGVKNGRPVRGVAWCENTAAGSRVKIVYADEKAPPEAWQKLNTTPSAVAAAADKVPLREYQFPDGTGTLGLPEGWQTQAKSILDPIVVDGPNDAKLIVNGGLLVNTPNGPVAQMVQQNQQQARQMGMPPLEYPGFFGEFGPPVQVLQTILPQLNRQKQKQNQPYGTIDKILTVLPARPQLPQGNAQDMEYLWTRHSEDSDVPMRSVLHAESAPLDGNAFYFQVSELAARQSEFAVAQPTMVAILNSAKPNPQQVARVQAQRTQMQQQQAAQEMDAIQRRGAESRARLNAQFEAGQARHRDQTAAYDRANHNWAVQQNLQARQHDNFVEYLGGTRDVLDTTTGQRTTHDLSDADAIASRLNDLSNDPGRFKSIPLRDDRDPLTR